jgi:aspartate/methionine/tyrosine aminotransferase
MVADPIVGFVPPPYPYDRLRALERLADSLPGGIVDCSIGNPVDPVPDVVLAALDAAAPSATGYPPTIGAPELREAAAAWIARRFGVDVPADQLLACIGTKEMVARWVLGICDPGRKRSLYPAIRGPDACRGCELADCAVPVPPDADCISTSGCATGRGVLLVWD